MTRLLKILIGSLMASGLMIGLVQTPDSLSPYSKADFGLSFAIGVGSAITGKFIYDRFFKDPANHGAAIHSQNLADRKCGFAFPTYDPGTGLYRDSQGRKKGLSVSSPKKT